MARRLLLAPPMYTGTYPPTAPRLRAQLFAAVLGVLLASFVTLLSRCAAAQPAADPFAEPPPISLDELKAPEPLRDPIARASIGMTALGVATALVGAGTWLSAEGHEVCGLTGCVTSTNEGTERDAGTALVGLGGGLAVSGAISLLVSLGKPLPPESARDDEGVAVTGLVFAELGAGLLGSALTFGGLSGDRPDFARGTPMFIASGVSGLVGMTLLIVGSDAMSPEERAAREQERNERRERKKRKRHGGGEAGAPRAVVATASPDRPRDARGKRIRPPRPAMMIGGILTLVLGTATGIGVVAAAAKGEIEPGVGIGLGAPLLAAGLGAGIPLTVIGAGSRTPAPPPKVSFGAGSVSMSMAF
jgi:hypothetical protein